MSKIFLLSALGLTFLAFSCTSNSSKHPVKEGIIGSDSGYVYYWIPNGKAGRWALDSGKWNIVGVFGKKKGTSSDGEITPSISLISVKLTDTLRDVTGHIIFDSSHNIKLVSAWTSILPQESTFLAWNIFKPRIGAIPIDSTGYIQPTIKK